MSFSSDIKQELGGRMPHSRIEQIAEIAAIIRFVGVVDDTPGQETIDVETERVNLAKKYLRLLKAAFAIKVDLEITKTPGAHNNQYRISLNPEGEREAAPKGAATVREVIDAACDWNKSEFAGKILSDGGCARAFIRGAFLAAGSMSAPGKSYHFEIVCDNAMTAAGVKMIIEQFDIHPKLVMRKGKHVLYLKDSTEIVEILNVMEAHQALMELENIRIVKEMKNYANRQLNCDSANINKIVRTAGRQCEDIRYIEQHMGFQELSPQLREMAEVRLEHPDISLQELGTYLNPPVGKSGVNHRLKKLSEIAEGLRLHNGF